MTWTSKALVMTACLLMIITSLGVVSGEKSTPNQEPLAPKTRAEYKYFRGNISNLTPENRPEINDDFLQVSGWDSVNNQVVGPFNASWNYSSMEFLVEVDISQHDTNSQWRFDYYDWYGYIETNITGTVFLNHPDSFSTGQFYDIPNGTLEYIPAPRGNLSFTIYNGTSGQPLEGVGFNFNNHPLHSTSISGNYTDMSGDAVFRDLQVDLDPNNMVSLYFEKGNFSTPDDTGMADFKLYEGNTTHYNYTLKENPLMLATSPSNGAVDVNNNKSRINIYLKFNDAFNQSTVDQNVVWLEELGEGKVDITYQFLPSGTEMKIRPTEDLKYNTTYRIVIRPRVQNLTGSEILWRTFYSSFTTILRPGYLVGTVTINGTTEPAPDGTQIKIDNSQYEDLDDGKFNFSVEDNVTGHSLQVRGPKVGGVNEYLYTGDNIDDIVVERGKTIVIDSLTVTKRPVRDVIFTVTNTQGEPLEDVTMTHSVTGESRTTDASGVVEFNDIRIDIATAFTADLEHYDDETVYLPPNSTSPTYWDVEMDELPLPLDVEVRGILFKELREGDTVDVDSYFMLLFDNPMDPETMTTDNIKILDRSGSPIPLDITNESALKDIWRVAPRTEMDYSSNYTLVVTEFVAEEGGTNPLWKDFNIGFNTQTLELAGLTGKVKVDGEGVEGVDIEIIKDSEVLGTGVSGLNGNYFIDMEIDQPTITGAKVIANGSNLGLTTGSVFGVDLIAGEGSNVTDIDLDRMPDWVMVQYPKTARGRMIVDASIIVRFEIPLAHDDMATFIENFTLEQQSTQKVDFNISVSDDGKNVTITPSEDLRYFMNYVLRISDFPIGEYHREMLSEDGRKVLIRGESWEITTELSPISVELQSPSSQSLDEVPLDQYIRLWFSPYGINLTLLENRMEIVEIYSNETVGGLSFSSDSEMRLITIQHDPFQPYTDYYIRIPAGQYGLGEYRGSGLKQEFYVEFKTINVEDPTLIDFFPGLTTREEPYGANVFKVTAVNNYGRAYKIVVTAGLESESEENYFPVANFTISPGDETQIDFDFSGRPEGDYRLKIEVYDPSGNVNFNTYYENIRVGEAGETDDDGDELNYWIWIVVVAIILVIIILAVFMVLQSRKKDIEEELREEFECPECHSLVSADDTVCPHCGAEFEEEAYKCPKCGSILDPEDDECPECGYDFSDQDQMELDEDEEDEDITELYEEDEDEEEIVMEETEEMEDEDLDELDMIEPEEEGEEEKEDE